MFSYNKESLREIDEMNNDENIAEMFLVLQKHEKLFKHHQVSFINGLEKQFFERGFLSNKQFYWLCVYFNMIASNETNYGYYDDFYGEWENGRF